MRKQAHKGKGTCPRPHSWEAEKLGLRPESFLSRDAGDAVRKQTAESDMV